MKDCLKTNWFLLFVLIVILLAAWFVTVNTGYFVDKAIQNCNIYYQGEFEKFKPRFQTFNISAFSLPSPENLNGHK